MATPPPIEFLSAVIVTSPEPERLAGFYADALGVPLVPEQHDEDLPHWGATLGQLHFAIHHPADFPEHRASGAGSVVIAFAVEDLEGTVARLRRHGVEPLYPSRDLGWTRMTAVRDPDGNLVELTQMADTWWARLDRRRQLGHDPVERWRQRQEPS
jgi:catechol 2,3-dioxygenase-like lactoylglutathione lyase family enzyme